MQIHYHHQIQVEDMLAAEGVRLLVKTPMSLEVKVDVTRRPLNLVYLRWLWQVERGQTIRFVVFLLWMA